MGWVIFEGHTRDQGDIEPNKGSYEPQNIYHGMKYLAKSYKFSPDVCTALKGLLTFTGFPQFQDYHLLTLPFDCESIRTVLFREINSSRL